jgi:carbamoyl-phosphate synthase large subunit
VSRRDRAGVIEAAQRFAKAGFTIKATDGTCQFLSDNGIKAEPVLKRHEGRPNLIDAIQNGEIHLVINTPIGKRSAIDDSYIRKAAIKHGLPYITSTAAAIAAAKGITAIREKRREVRSLQEYHADIG